MLKFKLLFIATLAALSVYAKDVTVNGLKYSLNGNGTASCTGSSTSADNVQIKSQINVAGKSYSVTAIADLAFENCRNLRFVNLPDGLLSIGRRAFYNCVSLKAVEIPCSVASIGFGAFENCTRLEKVSMPDDVKVEYYKKGRCRYSPFAGCHNLNEITGTNLKYPARFLDDLLTQYDNVPFAKRKMEIQNNSFSYWAASRIKQLMESWQEKREYESSEQWAARMSDESRRRKLVEIMESLRKEFVESRTSPNFITSLGNYDSDYGIFPVKTTNFGVMYMKVPANEADELKRNWQRVTVAPKYGIVDDQIAILSCKYTFNGKTYANVTTYENDTDVTLALKDLDQMSIEIHDDEREQGLVAERISSDAPSATPVQKKSVKVDNTIDKNIPRTKDKNENTFAVIIGNENYEVAEKVPFAINDAKVFVQYCALTLGIPEKNIFARTDVSLAGIRRIVRDIRNVAAAFSDREINIIFYYSGHGIPDESSHGSYILPIDVDGTSMEDCYSMAQLYNEFGSLNAKVYMFIDACFSGTVRGDGVIVAARGTVIKPKPAVLSGNMVVFSASSGNETAFPYVEKGHGLFTYFLLSKLRESRGDVTLGELGEYITRCVSQESSLVNRKPQTPTVTVSDAMQQQWSNMKLRQ